MTITANSVRAEIEIEAPIDRVWQILLDFDRYGDWNPFTPRVATTLRIGDRVDLDVRLFGQRLLHRVEWVTRNEPYTLGWEMRASSPRLLHAERLQVLTPRGRDRTHYRSEDVFHGLLRPVVLGLFGRAVERGFGDCARGLKAAAEAPVARADHREEAG